MFLGKELLEGGQLAVGSVERHRQLGVVGLLCWHVAVTGVPSLATIAKQQGCMQQTTLVETHGLLLFAPCPSSTPAPTSHRACRC